MREKTAKSTVVKTLYRPESR